LVYRRRTTGDISWTIWQISHRFLTYWPDDTGPGRTVWTSGGSWPAVTDSDAQTGRMTLIYGPEGWGFVREVASEWHVPRGDEEALVTQPD